MKRQDGQHRQRRQQQEQVQTGLRLQPEKLRSEMSVEIAEQQKNLEEEETGAPNRRAAAKPGQDVFANDELNVEKEKGAEEDGGRVQSGERGALCGSGRGGGRSCFCGDGGWHRLHASRMVVQCCAVRDSVTPKRNRSIGSERQGNLRTSLAQS